MRFPPFLLLVAGAVTVLGYGLERRPDEYIRECSPEDWPENRPDPPQNGACMAGSAPAPLACPADVLCTEFVPDGPSRWVHVWMPRVRLPVEVNVTTPGGADLCWVPFRAMDASGDPVAFRTQCEVDDGSVPRDRLASDRTALGAAGIPLDRFWEAVVHGGVREPLPIERFEEGVTAPVGQGIAQTGRPSCIELRTAALRVPGTYHCRDGVVRRGSVTVPDSEGLDSTIVDKAAGFPWD